MEISNILPPIIGYSAAFEKMFYPAMGWEFHTLDTQTLSKIVNHFDFLLSINPSLVPRLPHIKTSFPTHILRPYKKKSVEISLHDACKIRAQELISRNQEIILFWSGGIDSTLMACFLLDQIQNADQVVIYYTPESVRENPEFVKHIKKFNVKMVRWDLEYKKLFKPDQLIMTGEIGDSMSSHMSDRFFNDNKEWFLRPWQDFFIEKGMQTEEISCIENIIAGQDIDNIVNLIDVYWWFLLYISYQFLICRMLSFNLENLSSNNTVSFFECDIMNQWSLSNRNNLSRYQKRNEFKQCYRDEIAKFWPNIEYITNKPKVSSFQGYSWSTVKRILYKQDFLFLYWQDGKIKSYMPEHYPIFDREQILEDLKGMQ
jgi:hypothetical protein